MNFEEFIQHITGHVCEDPTKWPQVIELKGDDRLKHKNFQRQMDAAEHQVHMLKKKADVINAKASLQKSEFWNYIYEKHGLSPSGNYIIRDGKILMRPEK